MPYRLQVYIDNSVDNRGFWGAGEANTMLKVTHRTDGLENDSDYAGWPHGNKQKC